MTQNTIGTDGTERGFDPTKPFQTRSGRYAVIEHSYSKYSEHHGHVCGEPCIWSYTGHAGGEDETLDDDLVNIPAPAAASEEKDDAAFVERMDAMRGLVGLEVGGREVHYHDANFDRLIALARLGAGRVPDANVPQDGRREGMLRAAENSEGLPADDMLGWEDHSPTHTADFTGAEADTIPADAGPEPVAWPGLDRQVVVAAHHLTQEQRDQPEWVWFDAKTGMSCFGRFSKVAGAAPYVRVDLAAPPRADAGGVTEAAARIIDVMSGGDRSWRQSVSFPDCLGSTFLDSADWQTALIYARAALAARRPVEACCEEPVAWRFKARLNNFWSLTNEKTAETMREHPELWDVQALYAAPSARSPAR